MLDIFNNNAFGVTALTDVVNEMAYQSTRIKDLGLFTPKPITKTSVSIERIGNSLQLVSPTPRGGPGEVRDKAKRSLKSFNVPHFQRDWSIYADEVQNVRDLGSEDQLKTVQTVVAEVMGDNIDDFSVTEEHARLGAVKGIVTYADGATMNLFTEFGVAQEPEIAFDLTNATDGALRKTCAGIIRLAHKNLGKTGFKHIHAFCGDDFFDAIVKNKEVRATYEGTDEAKVLREGYVDSYRGSNPIFEFGGIIFENYGTIYDGGVGVAPGACHLFPVGVKNLFRTYYAPADYIETVNTLGRRLYSKQWPMLNGKGIEGELQSNALQLCTRPKVLMKGRMGA